MWRSFSKKCPFAISPISYRSRKHCRVGLLNILMIRFPSNNSSIRRQHFRWGLVKDLQMKRKFKIPLFKAKISNSRSTYVIDYSSRELNPSYGERKHEGPKISQEPSSTVLSNFLFNSIDWILFRRECNLEPTFLRFQRMIHQIHCQLGVDISCQGDHDESSIIHLNHPAKYILQNAHRL